MASCEPWHGMSRDLISFTSTPAHSVYLLSVHCGKLNYFQPSFKLVCTKHSMHLRTTIPFFTLILTECACLWFTNGDVVFDISPKNSFFSSSFFCHFLCFLKLKRSPCSVVRYIGYSFMWPLGGMDGWKDELTDSA